jgi:hypothetical protein
MVSIVGVGLLVSAGCAERSPAPFVDPGGDLFSVDGTVAGLIRNASGASVGYATVRAAAGSDAFPRTASSLTAPDGRYVIRIQGMNEPDARLPLKLSVTPPTGSCLLGRDTTGLTVLITRIYPSPDTTFVEMVLPIDTGKCAA